MVYFTFGKILTLTLELKLIGLCTSLSIVQSSQSESFQRFDFQGQIGPCPTTYEGFICNRPLWKSYQRFIKGAM